VWLLARQVVYQDQPPTAMSAEDWADNMIGLNELEFAERQFDVQYYKKSDWAYEREWRVAALKRHGETGRHSDWGFHGRELASVTFGTQCSAQDKADILAMLTGDMSHVAAFETIEDVRSHAYTFEKIKG
jgi:hypothetical protein